MPGYETIVITKPSCSEVDSKALCTKVESIIKQAKGEVLSYENWGKRKLSHKVKKESKGNYQYFAYIAKPDLTAELERNLRINENVILYMSVRVNNGKSPEDIEELKAPSHDKKEQKQENRRKRQ